MALFKFRKGRDEQPAPVAPAQSVEAVRRRAMHRLIGAVVLVLAGVIGFPMIFDNQPRPIPVDLPINIIDKSKAKPLVLPPAAVGTASVAGAASAAESSVVTDDSVAPVAASKPVVTESAPAPMAAPAVIAAPTEKAAVSPTELAQAKVLDAKKARALLEGRPLAGNGKTPAAAAPANAPPPASAKPDAASDERFVVQVGAFADAAKVREVRRKVESVGLKTYTQMVRTAEGERTRVRVGPFDNKAEAAKAADKIRKLSLSVAILTL